MKTQLGYFFPLMMQWPQRPIYLLLGHCTSPVGFFGFSALQLLPLPQYHLLRKGRFPLSLFQPMASHIGYCVFPDPQRPPLPQSYYQIMEKFLHIYENCSYDSSVAQPQLDGHYTPFLSIGPIFIIMVFLLLWFCGCGRGDLLHIDLLSGMKYI